MTQYSRQVQTQAQQQVQTLSPQQILVVKLLELPQLNWKNGFTRNCWTIRHWKKARNRLKITKTMKIILQRTKTGNPTAITAKTCR